MTATPDQIAHWLAIPYLPHGRTAAGCDCWGLVRIVRRALRGEDLPSYGAISPADKPGLTAAAGSLQQVRGFAPCDAQTGAIATVWRSGLCLHVGVVIGVDVGLAVLDTGRRCGPRWRRLADFERASTTVIYYDNN